MLAEAVAEVIVTAETAFLGYLHDAALGLLKEQVGSILQSLVLDIVGQFTRLALGEDGSHTVFRELEASHDSLTVEHGVEEEPFTLDGLCDVLVELFVSHRAEVNC